MAVPYHTHTFEIPTATKDDVIAGVSTEKALTPSSVGTAASKNIEDFATAEQGKKADNSIQPDDLATVATSGNYDDLKNRPTLGSVASHDLTEVATAAQGALAETAVQRHDIGTAAAHDATDFATAHQGEKADNALQPADVKSAAHHEASEFASANQVLPAGGGVGQVLAKKSATDRDAQWITVDAAASVAYAPQFLTTEQQGQARSNIGAGTSAWNWIINGDFSVMQITNKVMPPVEGTQGPDRWIRKGLYYRQYVEAPPPGTYTLMWEGGGDTTNTSPPSQSPVLLQIPQGSTAYPVFVPLNASKVMLLRGDWRVLQHSEAWAMCERPPSLELSLCQRYLYRLTPYTKFNASGFGVYNQIWSKLPVRMVGQPTVGSSRGLFKCAVTLIQCNGDDIFIEFRSSAAGDCYTDGFYSYISAEIETP